MGMMTGLHVIWMQKILFTKTNAQQGMKKPLSPWENIEKAVDNLVKEPLFRRFSVGNPGCYKRYPHCTVRKGMQPANTSEYKRHCHGTIDNGIPLLP